MTKILQIHQKDIVQFFEPIDQYLAQAGDDALIDMPAKASFETGWEKQFPLLPLKAHPTLHGLTQIEQARLALFLRTQSGAHTPRYRSLALLKYVIDELVPAGGFPFDYLYLERRKTSLWVTAPVAALVLAARAAGEAGLNKTLTALNQKRPHWMKGQQWVWNQGNGIPLELSEHDRDRPERTLCGEMRYIIKIVITDLTTIHQSNLQRLLLRYCGGSRDRELILRLVSKTGVDLQSPAYCSELPFGTILRRNDRELEQHLRFTKSSKRAADASPNL